MKQLSVTNVAGGVGCRQLVTKRLVTRCSLGALVTNFLSVLIFLVRVDFALVDFARVAFARFCAFLLAFCWHRDDDDEDDDEDDEDDDDEDATTTFVLAPDDDDEDDDDDDDDVVISTLYGYIRSSPTPSLSNPPLVWDYSFIYSRRVFVSYYSRHLCGTISSKSTTCVGLFLHIW